MSSVSIVRDSRTLIQNVLLPTVPTKWWPQLSFGLEAFALRWFQSAGSNARSVVANANTAASKVRRLLRNDKLAAHLGVVFDQLNLVRPGSYVNVDHSDFDGLTTLVGAIQTKNGRAVPCMVETTYALHIPAEGAGTSTSRWSALRTDMLFAREQQSFTGHTIDALQTMADRLGFWPKLVFDRGFANESMVEHLHAEGAIFYIRLKGGNYVECDGRQTVVRIQDLKEKDTAVELFGLTLRVVRSPKSRRAPEPWYILTNDFESSRNRVVKIYYHRFEIEEAFKDTKHLFELHQLKFMRPTSLKVVLWLVFLGIALLYVATKPTKQRTKATNPKKFVSWIRQAYEQFQRELTSYRGLTPRLNDRSMV
jgi:RNase P/RNase MRP subunit p29